MSQDQTSPVQIGDGQPTFGSDQHSVRCGRRSRRRAVVPVAADHAADHVAARQRRRYDYVRGHGRRSHGRRQENADRAQVPRLVSRPTMSGRHGQILNPTTGGSRLRSDGMSPDQNPENTSRELKHIVIVPTHGITIIIK